MSTQMDLQSIGGVVVHDRFKIVELGLYDAAEKWLRRRGVNTRDLHLWTAQLDTEEKTIEFRDWARRVDLARQSYRNAGWVEMLTGGGPSTRHVAYWQRIEGVDVGMGFGCVGPDLHEMRPEDLEFRTSVSPTGYHSMIGLDFPDPEILTRDIERLIRSNRERASRAKPKTQTKPPAVPVAWRDSPDPEPRPKEEDPMPTLAKAKPEKAKQPWKPGQLLRDKRAKDAAPPLSTFDPKRMAKLKSSAQPDVFRPPTEARDQAAIDVASTPAERLTADERKTLLHCEKTITRGADAFLQTGDALTVIQEQRLYRERYSTFEAYLWEEFHLEKSVAYRLIKAAATHTRTSAIADELGLLITNEAQLRALETLSDPQDLAAVLRRAAKRITPDANGSKVPTAKILTEAVKQETTSPEDLKHERKAAKERAAEAARLRAAHQRQGIAFDPSDFGDALTRQTRAALDRGDSWVACPRDAEFMASGIPDSHVWKGERPVWAYELNTLKVAIRKLLEERGTDDQFRLELAWLLTDAGIDVRSWEPPPKAKHSGRRAK